jgi:hypothetical protein
MTKVVGPTSKEGCLNEKAKTPKNYLMKRVKRR